MKRDVLGKTFFSDDERYADLINGLGCGGEQVVTEDDLQELDSQVLTWKMDIQGKKIRRKKTVKIRDLVRKTAFGVNFAIIGIENQEIIDYSMPLRGMLYTVGEYERQAAKIRRTIRKKRQGLNTGEYLYGFSKESKLYPTVIFVLYYGEEAWDGAKNLYEMMDFTDIPDGIRELVQNFSVNIVSIRELEDTSVFRTDIRQVFDFIRCSNDMEKLESIVKENPKYQEMDEDAYDMAVHYANAPELIEKKDYCRKEGKVNMCKALDMMCEREREKGLSQGIGQGRTMGMEEKTRRIVINMLERGMSDEDICILAECSQEYISKIKKEMNPQ